MSNNLSKLYRIAKETKDAYYAEWLREHCFTDYNYFGERGILAEAVGLTGVMLLLVRFFDAPDVYERKQNDPETINIIKTSLEYIYTAAKNEGYTVAPLRSAEETNGVIDKDVPYTDTLTWVLSSSTLITYAIRKGIIVLEETYEKMATELLAESLAYLTQTQLDSGAWGFSADKKAKESLYFTYATAASLADFLDYIMGELEYYENDENQKRKPEDFYDTTTLEALESYYEENNMSIGNIVDAVKKTKMGLQEWLIVNCLPLLPKISTCIPLDEAEREMIGVFAQTTSEEIEKLCGKDYINLYYTYYIIDILTTSSSDKRYPEIIKDRSSEIYKKFRSACEQVMNPLDFDYFFEEENEEQLFNEYINQAVHSSRMNLSAAMRTGLDFWSNEEAASELEIIWEHTELSRKKIEKARGSDGFSEPTLVPMSLRANAVYCFYIIEQTDVTVDNLFDIICADRSDKSATDKKGRITNTTVKNLWDRINYSLLITERVIEALVDYCDYLLLLDTSDSASGERRVMDVDEAIEHKIAEYISSETGRRLIRSMGFVCADEYKNEQKAVDEMIEKRINDILDRRLGGVGAVTENSAVRSTAENFEFDADKLIGILENMLRNLNTTEGYPERSSDNGYEAVNYALLALLKALQKKLIFEAIEDSFDSVQKSVKAQNAVSTQIEELIVLLAEKSDDPAGTLKYVYNRMISLLAIQ